MAQDLTVNAARSNLSAALVTSKNQPYTPATFPQLSSGETVDVNLYVTDGSEYDVRSGVATYTPKVTITLDDKTPKSGTFTISDGSDTTAQLDWDATSTEIETALNELNTDTGPNGDGVKVQRFANGTFLVKFDSAGAQSNLTIDASDIGPISSASVVSIVDGDVSTRSQQLVQIKADDLIVANGGSTISDGWSMTLDATGGPLLSALAAGDISANYSIQLTAPDTTIDVVATGPVILRA